MSEAQPEIRPRAGTPADADQVRAVFRRASLANARDRAALLAHPDALALDPASLADGRTTVAEADGRVVGFVTVAASDGSAELEDLFVDPDWWHQGVGRALVDTAADAARTRGQTRIEVTANEHARGFYEAVGFRETGTTSTRFGPAPRMTRDL